MLLDLYGTCHDRTAWDDPEAFHPDRFLDWDGSSYDLVPQGGGDHAVNHRCAGEWATIALLEGAADFLAHRLQYRVPDQDLRVDYARLPALPKSRFVIEDVRPTPAAGP